MNFLNCTLGRLWFSQNKIYGVGLNRVSLQNTRPKTIHWAEVYSKMGFYFYVFFCLFFLFKIFLILLYHRVNKINKNLIGASLKFFFF